MWDGDSPLAGFWKAAFLGGYVSCVVPEAGGISLVDSVCFVPESLNVSTV